MYRTKNGFEILICEVETFMYCLGEEETEFIQTDNGIFDHNLFGLTWGPSVAALSYIFDKVILYNKALRSYIYICLC